MRPEKWRLELSASKKRVLFGRVVHGEEDAECGQWWLFIYFIYIIIYLYIYLYNFFNKSCKPSYIYDIKHVVFQYHHNKKESSKEKLKTVE